MHICGWDLLPNWQRQKHFVRSPLSILSNHQGHFILSREARKTGQKNVLTPIVDEALHSAKLWLVLLNCLICNQETEASRSIIWRVFCGRVLPAIKERSI